MRRRWGKDLILDTEELVCRASDMGLELTANHIQRLAGESAIALDVIKERGYRSVERDAAANYRAQGWDNFATALPALEIPVFSPDGRSHVAQLRPDTPQRGQKYIWPQGEMMRIDVPPRMMPRIRDTTDLYLTEGVFKGDSAVSHGLDCISLMGVDAYTGFTEGGGRTALPDWSGLNLYRRKIIIAFDSDVMTKPAVQASLHRLWAFLLSRGAFPHVCLLPAGPDGAKVGLDDYFAQGGTAAQLSEFVIDNLRTVNESAMNSALSMTTYTATDGHLCMVKVDDDGDVTNIPVANFTLTSASIEEHNDGANTRRFYVMQGRTASGRGLRRIVVPSDEFAAMHWVDTEWTGLARIEAGRASKDHTANALKTLYFDDVETSVCRIHTGWAEINGRQAYISGSGALREDGIDGSVVTTLDASVAGYMLTNPTPDEIRAGIEADLEFLKITPSQPEIAMLLLGATYYAPLCEWLTPTFSVFIVGQTGSFKTETAALLQGHFGRGFNAKSLPGSWSSTANFIERQSFLAKDALITIDDFKPMTGNAQEMMKKADYVLRNAANRAARGRLNASAEARTSFIPRGLLLVTGEEEPENQSLHARLLMLTLDRGLIAPGDLRRLQLARDGGALVDAMSGYIRDLAGRTDLKARLRAMYEAAVKKMMDLNPAGTVYRNYSNMAFLAVGFELFCEFARRQGVVNEDVFARLIDRFYALNATVVTQQEERQLEDHNLISKTISSVTWLLRSRRATLRGPIEHHAELACEEWGWRRTTSGDIEPVGASIGSVFMPDHGSPKAVISAKALHDTLKNQTRDHWPAYRRWITEMEAAGISPPGTRKGADRLVVLLPNHAPSLFTLREDLLIVPQPRREESDAF